MEAAVHRRFAHGVGLLAVLCAACGDRGVPRVDRPGDAAAASADAAATDAGAAAIDAGDAARTFTAEPPELLRHARDWPLPNRDYENTRATFDSTLHAGNVATLEERFRVPLTGASAFGYATSAALVLGERIYLQDMASNVLAIDRADGRVIWSHTYGEPSVGPNGVAVGHGKVFAMRGDVGAVALDAESGDELWRFDPALDSSEGLDIQPLVYAGSLLLSTVPASVRGGYLGGSRGELFALDVRDGQPRWRFDTVDSDDLWGDPERNSGGGAWYPPTVDRERGVTYWGTGNPGPLGGTPPYGNGESRPGDNAYTSGVLAIGLAHGELRWFHQEQKHDLFDWDFQNPPILVRGAELGNGARDRLIGSGKTGTVIGLDAESGALLFRAKVGVHENDELLEIPEDGARVAPGVLGGVLTPAAYAEGVVYLAVVDYPTTFTRESWTLDAEPATGEVVALDARDGEVLWTASLPAAAYGAATVVNDLVLVPDADGVVHALAREDGSSVFRYETHGGINAPLTVAGDLVLVPVGVATAEPALLGLAVP